MAPTECSLLPEKRTDIITTVMIDTISISLSSFVFRVNIRTIWPPSKKYIGSILKKNIIILIFKKIYFCNEKLSFSSIAVTIISAKFTDGPLIRTNSFLFFSSGYLLSLKPKTDADIRGLLLHSIHAAICPDSCNTDDTNKKKKIFNLSKIKAKKIKTGKIYSNYSTAYIGFTLLPLCISSKCR